jgi:hypothetical protein
MSGIGLGLKAAALLARVSGLTSAAKNVASKVPPKVWYALAIVAALVAGYLVHQHLVHKFRTEVQRAQMASDNDHWKRKLAAAHADAIAWKLKAEAAAATISKEERTQDEETIRSDAAVADALGMRGPGAAASHCGPVGDPGAGAGAGGHEPPVAEPDVTGPAVPSENWALVPWDWLVGRAREHDDGLAENLAWRNNDARQRTASAAALAQSPK